MEQADSNSPKSDSFRNAASVCGIVALSLGVLGLLAWISGLRVLSSIAPAYIPMASDTAVIFGALGLFLLLDARRVLSSPGRGFAALVASVASVYGLLKFVEYFVKIDLTFENFLFPIANSLGSYPLNRMSPITGALFLLSGIALVSILWGKGGAVTRNLAGGFGILVFIAGFVATTGYLFATPLLYGGDIIPLAPTTASAFLMLGIGLVAAAGPVNIFVRPFVGSSVRARMLRAFLPLTAAVVLLQGYLQEVMTEFFNVNHALLSAAFSLIFVTFTAVIVTQVARLISRTVDVAEVERKRAEDLLRSERNLLRTLIDNVPDQIFAKDTESKFILNNSSYARLKGSDPEGLLGKSDLDFSPPDLAARYQAEDQAIIRSGRAVVDQEELASDGSEKESWSSTTKVPLRDSRGEIIGVVGIKRDITERKNTEQELRASELRYRELFAAAQRQSQELSLLDRVRSALARELELPIILRTVVEAIAKTFGYTHVSLYLLQGEYLILQHQVGYDHVFERIPVSEGISGRVVRGGRAVLVEDVTSEADYLAAMAGITSEVCVPLFDRGTVVGTLNVESTLGMQLGEADLRLMGTLSEDVSIALGQARLYAKVQRLAITDDLTGLPNRRHFFELAEAELDRARRLAHPLCAIMMDIDYFKRVNDHFGHAIGDQVLRSLAELWQENIREVDILGRYGGEEFALILPKTDLASAKQIAERLRQRTEETPVRTRRDNVSITLSLGVAAAAPDTPDLATLLDGADHALYAAKHTGRNCVVVAEQGVG